MRLTLRSSLIADGGDFRDIQTGIDNLIAKGIADSTKLAQSGWSYGGYMTAWTLTQTNRFKAVMVGAGLTNMASMYGTNDIPRTIDGYFESEPWNDAAQYSAKSAMTFIKQAKTPTLIEHGQADQREGSALKRRQTADAYANDHEERCTEPHGTLPILGRCCENLVDHMLHMRDLVVVHEVAHVRI